MVCWPALAEYQRLDLKSVSERMVRNESLRRIIPPEIVSAQLNLDEADLRKIPSQNLEVVRCPLLPTAW